MMERRRLGRTDLAVSAISMGLWNIAGDATWGAQDERDSIEAIEAALACGINFFDTAEAYGGGYSEEVLGKTRGSRRREVVIGRKASSDHMGGEDLISACEGRLNRLRTDYIDLYMLHWPHCEVPFEETMGAMTDLIEQGKVRVAGVSNFGARDLGDILGQGRVEANQLAYNLLFRAVEFEVLPACLESGVSVTCYSSLAQGLLTGKFASADDVPEGRARTRHFSDTRPQVRHGEAGAEEETFGAIRRVRRIAEDVGAPMNHVALAWLLAQPGVASVIAGARNAEQARRNAAAGDLKVDREAIDGLTEATDALKTKLGPNPDMWDSESRIR